MICFVCLLQNFKIEIIHITQKVIRHSGIGMELDVVDEIEFDMDGIDAAIANAIRRILLSEVSVRSEGAGVCVFVQCVPTHFVCVARCLLKWVWLWLRL